jgi:hypothetical protein
MGQSAVVDFIPIPRHSSCTEVEKELQSMREAGWRAGANAAGHGILVFCPCGKHKYSVAGTPKNCGNEAKRVRQAFRKCASGSS